MHVCVYIYIYTRTPLYWFLYTSFIFLHGDLDQITGDENLDPPIQLRIEQINLRFAVLHSASNSSLYQWSTAVGRGWTELQQLCLSLCAQRKCRYTCDVNTIQKRWICNSLLKKGACSVLYWLIMRPRVHWGSGVLGKFGWMRCALQLWDTSIDSAPKEQKLRLETDERGSPPGVWTDIGHISPSWVQSQWS